MTVGKLIDLLEDMNPDATVLMESYPDLPTQNHVEGVEVDELHPTHVIITPEIT